MAEPLVAGVDSSTQSTKVELRGLEAGALVATGRGAHPPTSPPVSEQDPGSWWSALTEALGQVSEHLPRVVGISVAGQQHGLVAVDAEGRTIRPAKLWNDTTSAPQAAALRARIGEGEWAARCGLVPVASFTITKLAWLAEHEPDALARVDRLMLPHDWLTWRLTGRHVTDRGDASGTGWWSPVDGTYREDLLSLVVDDAPAWLGRLPEVLGPSEAAGPVANGATDGLLGQDVVVGPGTGDNMGAALGLALQEQQVVLSLGTSGTAYAVSSTPTTDVTGAVAGFADAAGGFLPLVATLNATKVTETVARWLGVDVAGLTEMALAAPPRPDLVLVPYFDGERTPNLPDATGTWRGLRNDTTREDLARAAFTGVVNGLLAGVDALGAAGVEMDGTLRLIGGGARSAAYRQITADLWGSPVTVHADAEPVATGACVQAAAVVTGGDPKQVGASWHLGEGEQVTPRRDVDAAAVRAAYREAASTV